MEDSKDSSEESDRPEAVKDTARFYECMFCRRGFSTAQALGGHMNIHRRDRAKMRQPSLPSSSRRPSNDSPSHSSDFLPQHLPNYPSYQSESYPAYLPTSTSSYRQTQFRADSLGVGVPPLPQQLSLFGEESNPRQNITPSTRVMDREEERKEDEDGELDLELRLGHEP